MRVQDVTATDVVQLCMTGTAFTGIVEYLAARGLEVHPMPGTDTDPDDIPTFMITIGERLWRTVNDL